MSLQAGQLDRWITLQAKVSHKDPIGGVTSVWSDFACVPAQQLLLSATDVQRWAGRAPETIAKYRIRFRDDLTTANGSVRFVVNDVPFVITAIDYPDRRATLLITGQAS